MDKLTDLLERLAEKLGTTVEYIYPHLVDYYVAKEVVLALVVASIFLMLTIVFIYATKKADWKENDGETPACCIQVISGVFALVMFFALVVVLSSAIVALYTPEGFTLNELLELAR